MILTDKERYLLLTALEHYQETLSKDYQYLDELDRAVSNRDILLLEKMIKHIYDRDQISI